MSFQQIAFYLRFFYTRYPVELPIRVVVIQLRNTKVGIITDKTHKWTSYIFNCEKNSQEADVSNQNVVLLLGWTEPLLAVFYTNVFFHSSPVVFSELISEEL